MPVEIWQKKYSEWSFKHDSTEEIESIILTQTMFFPDSNKA
jgi:hypothetical protein